MHHPAGGFVGTATEVDAAGRGADSSTAIISNTHITIARAIAAAAQVSTQYKRTPANPVVSVVKWTVSTA